jgi:hypothetical protein
LIGPSIGFKELPTALPMLLQDNRGRPHSVVAY